ncbi:tumor necrosis factor receptor superfamily member 6B-like [Pholidichthys leucotaenia]
MLTLPALLLLFGALLGASAGDPTYEYTDPLTGETLTCNKCPPGYHLAAHCTSTTPTKCARCKNGHFTELWNYLPRCLYCSNFCLDNQEVEIECSPETNRVCRCKEGFYMDDDFCIRHSECDPGQGVKSKGTSNMNTVCEACPDGYFSNSSSALEPCTKHQECANGELELLAGSVNHDSVCGSCEDLANGGKTLRAFLSRFLSAHRMRVGKMKNFIRNIHRSEDRRTTRDTLPKGRQLLMDHIRTWLAQAPEEQLRDLPDMLKASHLNIVAEKLENRLEEIKKQSPHCSLWN